MASVFKLRSFEHSSPCAGHRYLISKCSHSAVLSSKRPRKGDLSGPSLLISLFLIFVPNISFLLVHFLIQNQHFHLVKFTFSQGQSCCRHALSLHLTFSKPLRKPGCQ